MSDSLAAARGRSSWHRGSDEQLVDAVREGAHGAVEVLFERHHEGLLSFCRHMLGRRDEAEEAVRASFEQALIAVRRHDRPVRIKALLYSVARTRCVAALEARPRGDARTDMHGLDPEVLRDVELQLLAGSVARLPLDQRVVLLLRELECHSRDEIAAIAGCPAEKADALLTQARTALTGTEAPSDWACAHVRPLLAASGGAQPAREAMRRHVAGCASCSEFRVAVTRQRRYLAIILPVAPSTALVAPAAPAASAAAAAPAVGEAPAPPASRLARVSRAVRRPR
jgi:RNA polymerase sigma factor (sigma-70 family)